MGVCAGCGTVVHTYQARTGRWVIEIPGVNIVTADDANPVAAGHPCPGCLGTLLFPREQDTLLAAFMIGGWSAITADMFGPAVRGALAAREVGEEMIAALTLDWSPARKTDR